MKRIFKTRVFSRWIRKTELTDDSLRYAVKEMSEGLIDVDLGGGLVKKRVGLAGRGKRGGARTIVATNKGNKWFFLIGFEKNDRSTVNPDELDALKAAAFDWRRFTDAEIKIFLSQGTLEEIEYEPDAEKQNLL
jgi:hypothetical protein